MNIKTMPGEFFIGMFIVAFFLYSFVAFRSDFEEKWRAISLGDSQQEAIASLGSGYQQRQDIAGNRLLAISRSEDSRDIATGFLVWEIGVNNFYTLGISQTNRVILKAQSEISRVGAGSSTSLGMTPSNN